jgi:HK97 family phage major capsid protein
MANIELKMSNEQLEKYNNLVNEARDLTNDTEKFKAKMKEIEDFQNQVDIANKNLADINALTKGNTITNIQNKGVNVVGTVIDSTNSVTNEDMFASLDYRKAFMNNVIKGVAMPSQFLNADANTKTTDVGVMIPSTVMEKIIEKLEATGMILPLVTKTGYKGGVTIPTSSVKPVATWVVEGAGSDKQKKTTGSITFAYYKLRCAVSVSFETDNITLAVFETTLINNVTQAMVKALEQSIVSGTGTGQPKGILAETPEEGQALTIAKAVEIKYTDLLAAEAALPLEYEASAVWCMSKKSFMAFLGMTDTTGQPIARVNYGIGGKPERTLLGRTVVLNNYVSSYASTVEADTIFAFLFNFSDYVLNTNYQMTLKKYEDNDTDDQVTKAIMLADGKVVDKNSLVTLTKKFA